MHAEVGPNTVGPVVGPEQFNLVRPTAEEHAVLAAAREYYRTGGDPHNELMDAVQQLERSYLNASTRPVVCFCGTGHEHTRGAGYHCRKADGDDHG